MSYSFNGEFLGIGHYQIGSITVRILSFDRLGVKYLWHSHFGYEIWIFYFLDLLNKSAEGVELSWCEWAKATVISTRNYSMFAEGLQ